MSWSLKAVALVAGMVFAILLSGCARGTAPDTDKAKLEGTWVLKAYIGMRDMIPSDPSVSSEVSLKDGQVTGFGGVNSFHCTYQASSDGKISFGEISATTIKGPAAAMEQEEKFLAMLKKADLFEVYQGDLVLSENGALGSSGLVVLAPKSGTSATPLRATTSPS